MKKDAGKLFFGIVLISSISACGESPRTAPQPTKTTPPLEVPHQDSSAAPSKAGAPSSSSHAAGELMSYECASDGERCDNSLVARDRREAEWLIENGYPSPAVLASYARMSRTELKSKADEGSLSAMVVYGTRIASEGDTKNGVDYVIAATQRGSIYGYYGLSAIYQNSPQLKNVVESGAFLRVAYILGDSKAATELQIRLPGLTQSEQVMIDERAASLYQTLAHSKAPSPRPL